MQKSNLQSKAGYVNFKYVTKALQIWKLGTRLDDKSIHSSCKGLLNSSLMWSLCMCSILDMNLNLWTPIFNVNENIYISMTLLLAHTVAQPTKWRFLPKNLNQLVNFVIEPAFTWSQVDKNRAQFQKTNYFKKWSYQKMFLF